MTLDMEKIGYFLYMNEQENDRHDQQSDKDNEEEQEDNQKK